MVDIIINIMSRGITSLDYFKHSQLLHQIICSQLGSYHCICYNISIQVAKSNLAVLVFIFLEVQKNIELRRKYCTVKCHHHLNVISVEPFFLDNPPGCLGGCVAWLLSKKFKPLNQGNIKYLYPQV